jgi:hypothetical protein
LHTAKKKASNIMPLLRYHQVVAWIRFPSTM